MTKYLTDMTKIIDLLVQGINSTIFRYRCETPRYIDGKILRTTKLPFLLFGLLLISACSEVVQNEAINTERYDLAKENLQGKVKIMTEIGFDAEKTETGETKPKLGNRTFLDCNYTLFDERGDAFYRSEKHRPYVTDDSVFDAQWIESLKNKYNYLGELIENSYLYKLVTNKDANGRVIEEKQLNGYDSVFFKIVYDRMKNGRLIKVTKYFKYDKFKIVYEKKFDKNGRVIKETEFDESGPVLVSTFKWNRRGKLISKVVDGNISNYDYLVNNVNDMNRRIKEKKGDRQIINYGDDGKILNVITYKNNVVIDTVKFKYQSDTTIVFNRDLLNVKLNNKTIIELTMGYTVVVKLKYDAFGNILFQKCYPCSEDEVKTLFENPFKRVTNEPYMASIYSYKFDNHGNWIERTENELDRAYDSVYSPHHIVYRRFNYYGEIYDKNNLIDIRAIEKNGVIRDSLQQASDIKKEKETQLSARLEQEKLVEIFLNDNVSLEKTATLRQEFIEGVNQKKYNGYSDYTYKMNFNAPYLDESRGFEPRGIDNGIQRAYFINSESVCIQREFIRGELVEEIYFHPIGEIYTVIKYSNGSMNGFVKFVDLNNTVFLEGNIGNNIPYGAWRTPASRDYNMSDRKMVNQYPGIANSINTFINFYKMNSDSRQFGMN